jgi:2-oxoglutarate-Fe(II)-dependent oxygenase superfamily protein
MNSFGRYASQASDLRAEFDENDCVLLRGFLDPAIGKAIKKQLPAAPFIPAPYYKNKVLTGLDEISEKTPYPFLHFLMNSVELAHLVEDITQSRNIGSFFGRLYRMLPRSGHFLSWHDDLDEKGRVAALSLNLSPSPYKGGVLQIRNRSQAENPREIPNTRFGDAVLFRVAERLEHRLTPMEGDCPKIAYSGWFKSSGKRSKQESQ